MKKLIYLVAASLVMLAAISCQGEKTNTIKVISYNIRVGSGDWDGDNKWDNRKQASLNMINDEKPTLFGLQEATPIQMEYLIENLPQYGHIGVGREDGVASGEHMSIFYLKDEVELLDGGTFWLSETPEEPSMGWDAACKRTCTWTKLKMKSTGKEFVYMNTHLDHVGIEARKQGLALIVERANEIVPEGTVFLTADFNALTTNPIFDDLKSVMKDAREEAPVTDRRGTYNGWNKENVNNPDCVIDHIFYRAAEAHSFRVLCDKNYGAPYISDHYPVVMEATF